MSFPDKEKRQKCWDSRDRYWECLDKSGDQIEKCVEVRTLYEATCPSQWVKHFDRKREYLKFKERIQNDGLQTACGPVTSKNSLTAPRQRVYRQTVTTLT
uniref:Cytochrome c oxidase assembly factor 6 homolog n=1 Tax=Daphnia galeata TaxID=27404 RepID=A0A8J2RE48_9CRUS|nr:unnamed protein product [Daphnia galeata]